MQTHVPSSDLQAFMRESCHIIFESAKFVPILSDKNRDEFREKLQEIGKTAGWKQLDDDPNNAFVRFISA
jgi:hypothetical protein